MLSLQPSKLKLSQQLTKNRETNLSRTFYPLSIKRGKRFISFNEQDNSSREEETKKRKIAREKEILSTPPYLANFSSLESRYSLANQYCAISSIELMKA